MHCVLSTRSVPVHREFRYMPLGQYLLQSVHCVSCVLCARGQKKTWCTHVNQALKSSKMEHFVFKCIKEDYLSESSTVA